MTQNKKNEEKGILKDLKKKLTKVSSANVRLFFIIRNRKTNGKQEENEINEVEYEYEVLKTSTTENIRETFIAIGKNVLDKLLEMDRLQLKEYDAAIEWDLPTIEFITGKDVKYLDEIKSAMMSVILRPFNLSGGQVPLAYAVKMNDVNLILFRKYSQGKILEKRGWIPLFVKDGMFNRINDAVLTIDEEIDCIYDIDKDIVYILNKKHFEEIFSFMKMFLDGIETNRPKLEEGTPIDNVELLVNLCEKDQRKIRKLYNILKRPTFQKLNKQTAKAINQQYQLGLQFTPDGDIVVNSLSIWPLLRVLDDDYLVSPLTDNLYEVYSKSKITSRPRILIYPTLKVEGFKVTINGAVINADNVVWNWGDGREEASTFPASHTYNEKGKYKVTVTASKLNHSASKETTVNIF